MTKTAFAKLSAVAGVILIFLAGILTASDHLQRDSAACSVVGQLPAATTITGSLQVLGVSNTGDPPAAVVSLGKPLCVSVANVRPAAELEAVKAEAGTTKAARDETVSELRKAQAELRKASGEARKAADSKVKELTAQLTQEDAALTKALEAQNSLERDVELALFINGKRTPARVNAPAIAAAQPLRFDLEQNWDARSDDAAVWRELLSGLPQGGKRAVTVGVGAPDATRPTANWQSVGPNAAPLTAELRVFQPLIAALAGIGFLLLLVAIVVAGQETALLRDRPDKDSRYSLGRVQMAFWTVLTVFGFVFIWVLTGQYVNVITTATFTLLGISGATALAAIAIESGANAAKSKSFFADILSDGSGELQLHRIQVGLWTLVFGTIYFWNVLDSLVLTEFDANMLLLLGIANGVYAGFKTQEKS